MVISGPGLGVVTVTGADLSDRTNQGEGVTSSSTFERAAGSAAATGAGEADSGTTTKGTAGATIPAEGTAD